MSRPISSLDWRGAGGPAETLVLRGARAFDPRAGLDSAHDIVIRDGRIAELASAGSAEVEGAEIIEADGLIAVPAFFDPHVHLRTPGREDKEDIETGSRAAAAGGYCGVIAMANTEPPVDTPAAIESLRERAQADATVPVGFVATVTRGMRGEELTDMAELADAGAVGFSDDGLPIQSARVMRRALQYQALADLQIALHEEDPELSGSGVMHEGEAAALLGMTGIPSVSESTMIARDCALAAFEDARIHVQHLSARESIEVIEAAKERGVEITCEATPHHLTLTDDEVRSLDARFKMNPPLRSEDDRQALIAAVRSGLVDTIATDHAPHTLEDKEVPFEAAAMGVTGLETAFAVLYTDLVVPGILDLPTVIDRLSAGAAAFGFETSSLKPESEANVALLDLDAEWEAGAEGWESRSENSCFAGKKLQGRSLMTIAAGQVAFRQRSFAMGGRVSAYVLLEDGTRFDGESCGAEDVNAVGEVVFNTSMTGYQESVTDPSYAGQLITFTYPMIGNYGVAERAMESDRIHARAAIMRDARNSEDAATAELGWLDWLRDCGVPAITGVDTRALVRHIRDEGAMRGGVFGAGVAAEEARQLIAAEPLMAGADFASKVTPGAPIELDGSGPHVVALDTGIKLSIVRQFQERGAKVTLLPCSTGADEVMARDPDLVFLANGPGDPAAVAEVTATVREIVGKMPVVGICLGHQLLCRAVGLDTFKLPFGHRGANHPVKELATGRIEITSQNHGFAVALPDGGQTIETDEPVRWDTDFGAAELSHLNLYDRTVEGLVLKDVAARTVQYHPEAGPGPHDSRHLFDEFLELAA